MRLLARLRHPLFTSLSAAVLAARLLVPDIGHMCERASAALDGTAGSAVASHEASPEASPEASHDASTSHAGHGARPAAAPAAAPQASGHGAHQMDMAVGGAATDHDAAATPASHDCDCDTSCCCLATAANRAAAPRMPEGSLTVAHVDAPALDSQWQPAPVPHRLPYNIPPPLASLS